MGPLDARMMDFPLTSTHLVRRAKELFADTEVVSRRLDKSLARTTYGAILRRASQLAHALGKLGVKQGDRVATLAFNSDRHLETYIAVPTMGAVLHTLNVRLALQDLVYIAGHAGDRALVVDESLLPLARAVAKEVTSIERVIVFRDAGSTTKLEANEVDYEELIAPEPDDYDWPELDERSAAILCYTSGTTGRPKGVAFTHRSCILHTFAVCVPDVMGFGNADVVLPVVPMFHANAWGLPFACLMTGAKVFFPGCHLDPVSLLDAMEAEKVTVAAGVPTVWIAILNELDRTPDRWNLSSVRAMVIGGSAAPPAMIDGFEKRHGLHVLHAWGMTELNPLGSMARIKSDLQHTAGEERLAIRSSQGMPAPFVEIRHTGTSGEVLPWDGLSMGELECRGPWVASSYVGDEDPGRWTDDGWFRTGDVVTIDKHGYIRICDRSKDVIKSGGEWISSVEIENALMSHPAVLEAAVFAGRHPKWDERPIACIVKKPGQEVGEAELGEFLLNKVAKWWRPDLYLFVTEIPRTATGKFLKTKLREMYGERLWTPSVPPAQP